MDVSVDSFPTLSFTGRRGGISHLNRLIISGLLLLLAHRATAQDTNKLSTRVISSFPSPGPSPQGLAWDGVSLWLADDSTDTLYVIDPASGTVDTSFPAPGPEPKGLTFDGTYILNLDNNYRKIYKINPINGLVVDSLELPTEFGTDKPFHGLTWDGTFLYTCFEAGWSSQIVKMDVSDGSVSRIAYTRGFPKGLAFDGAYIWNCLDNAGVSLGLIDQYDLNGRRLDSFDAPGYYPTGVTYDGSCFWITEKESNSLYQIQMATVGMEDVVHVPRNYVLYQNFPNPFNSVTSIKYQIDMLSDVSLAIYDLSGKPVKDLIHQNQSAGKYKVIWDGKDQHGRDVSSGMYLYILRADHLLKIKTMLFIK